MDKLIFKDYASWRIDNQETIEQFKHNSNVVYDRFEPVYVVLNHIYDMVVEGEELDEDLEVIFESGFGYLSNQFEIIKIYYDTLFQQSCDDFKNYADVLLYLIYISDLRLDLENNDIDIDMTELDDLETSIENFIMERQTDFAFLADRMNKIMSEIFKQLDYEYVSIIDIFVEIAENLGIFLYEDSEYVVGREV